jgi:hypothetical protein
MNRDYFIKCHSTVSSKSTIVYNYNKFNNLQSYMIKKHKNLSNTQWKTARYWQTLYIYFWLFALIGHYLEVFCAQFYHLFTGAPAWHPIIITAISLSAPYGLGVTAIILFIAPLVKNRKLMLL